MIWLQNCIFLWQVIVIVKRFAIERFKIEDSQYKYSFQARKSEKTYIRLQRGRKFLVNLRKCSMVIYFRIIGNLKKAKTVKCWKRHDNLKFFDNLTINYYVTNNYVIEPINKQFWVISHLHFIVSSKAISIKNMIPNFLTPSFCKSLLLSLVKSDSHSYQGWCNIGNTVYHDFVFITQ